MTNQNTKEKMSEDSSRLRFLLLGSFLVTFLLIVIGGIIRVKGTDLACPDWPSCLGQWFPPLHTLAILEYSHRLLSLLLVPLLLFSLSVTWKSHRSVRWILRPLVWALALLVIQGLLGGLVVLGESSPYLVAIHLGLALLLLGLLSASTVTAFVLNNDPTQVDRLAFKSPYARGIIWTLLGLFLVLISGTFVAASTATYVCDGWPLCNGELIPSHPLGWINMAHRSFVGIIAFYILYLTQKAWRSQRSQRAILSAATLTAVLYFAQLLLGGISASRAFPTYMLGLHIASSAAVWTMLLVTVMLVGLAARGAEEEALEASLAIDGRQRMRDLLGLTKPIIVALLLVTTYAGMVLGARELPSLSLSFWTLLGGALAAGGSGAVNQYIDRELDQRMTRTAKRPIASGRMTAAEGLAFGLSLLVISFYLLAAMVNLLAALLALAGMIYYIVIYSLWLKKATVQNIVIGGGAGAIPPMVGWAAATGGLDTLALFLFAIIFMWTPPHFWALALIRKKEYARAGVPMLPVVKGDKVTRWQIFLYTVELVLLTILLPVLGLTGLAFLYAALILGGLLLYIAWKVWRIGGNKIAWRMYRYSSMYLAFLFAALVFDALI
jgi:protoheme IX farnesyltransferase